ncbi:MAG: hypothetical protein MZV64_34730 [Ignavibacteriales bacterium]|nr:hypothetical protein [Ignavibacteriales bacterium]
MAAYRQPGNINLDEPLGTFSATFPGIDFQIYDAIINADATNVQDYSEDDVKIDVALNNKRKI